MILPDFWLASEFACQRAALSDDIASLQPSIEIAFLPNLLNRSTCTRSRRLSRKRDGRLEARFPQESVGCYRQSVAQAFVVVLSPIGEASPDRGPAGRTFPQGLAGGIGD